MLGSLWTSACTVMFNFTFSVVTVLCVKVMFWHKLWSVSSGATHYVHTSCSRRKGRDVDCDDVQWEGLVTPYMRYPEDRSNRFFQSIVICAPDCIMSHSRAPYSNIYYI